MEPELEFGAFVLVSVMVIAGCLLFSWYTAHRGPKT